jgi:PAS domain S-box-containing protein
MGKSDTQFAGELELTERDLNALLDLSESLSDTAAIETTLLKLAELMADVLGSDRCSVVLLDEEGKQAIIVAASDDPAIKNLMLDLSVYPELREVVRTGEPLTIDDVQQAPIFDEVREKIQGKALGSTILFPVRVERKVQGVLHLRTQLARQRQLTVREIRFGRIVANATGIALRNARLYETVRGRSGRRLNDMIRAERRLKQIEKYQRFFDLAGDGLMIIDGTGRILFANHAAQRILGFDARDISSITLYDIVEPAGRAPLEQVIESVGTGSYLRDIDVPVLRASGELAVLSLTTATLDDPERTEDIAPILDDSRRPRPVGLKKDATAIVSFRDVTETRRMQEELRRTKDFLMNLIESSADAIVAADMSGRILIFNEVAERITGFSGMEMIGNNVAQLYPTGTAHRIMTDLRSKDYGGAGKLEERREHLMTRTGEAIPVNLAAAIVYDQGKEVATVGIFSDLRERLQMEEELHEAQKKLELNERQAAVVQLAGAAAHELNQPLTSIIGSIELMQRKVEAGTPIRLGLDRLLADSERMAEMVKKLGQIARYETKPYMGRTEILDLDAASKGQKL